MVHVISARSCPSAWIAGAKWLLANHGRWYNLILDIEHPDLLAPGDFGVTDRVDAFLRKRGGTPLSTAAGTIFPAGPYLRQGADGVYERFLAIYDKAKRECSSIKWGTYAGRILKRTGQSGEDLMPLRIMVDRMRSQLDKKSPKGAAYEIGLLDMMSDLSISDPTATGPWAMGLPCLSHLSFKLVTRDHIGLTALYRNHYYIGKALGNLIGLAQLQRFVAAELEIAVGPLVCHSTLAQIDTSTRDPGWNLAAVHDLLHDCAQAQSAETPQPAECLP